MSAGLVHLVEDDAALADALSMLLASRGVQSRRFTSGESFVDAVRLGGAWPPGPACVLLDVRMHRMSGLEVFEWLAARYPNHPAPVVFLTGHGDVQMAVQALKQGAFDFFEKPFDGNRLVDRALEAIALSAHRMAQASALADLRARLARLSQREREVMDRIVDGKLNKVIAAELGISMRTVEVHRANIFDKMQVRSAVELARLLETQGEPR